MGSAIQLYKSFMSAVNPEGMALFCVINTHGVKLKI